MKCESCNGTNMNVVLEQQSGKMQVHKTGILARMGRLFLILCTAGLWILVPKRKEHGKTKYSSKRVALCQSCGHKQYLE